MVLTEDSAEMFIRESITGKYENTYEFASFFNEAMENSKKILLDKDEKKALLEKTNNIYNNINFILENSNINKDLINLDYETFSIIKNECPNFARYLFTEDNSNNSKLKEELNTELAVLNQDYKKLNKDIKNTQLQKKFLKTLSVVLGIVTVFPFVGGIAKVIAITTNIASNVTKETESAVLKNKIKKFLPKIKRAYEKIPDGKDKQIMKEKIIKLETILNN